MARGILCCALLIISIVDLSQAQNDDSIIFDGPTQRPARFPLNPSSTPSTFTPNAEYNRCVDSCLATSEYNPVCGSDNTVYSNPGRLGCAQNCGNRNLQLVRYGQCNTNASG